MTRDVMQYDVVIVGAGPAGLSAAIRLKQLAREQNQEINVCVVEKGSEVGAHLLSGAVLEPRALNELIPDWQSLNAPLNTPVKQDKFLWLTSKKAFKLPTPAPMKNHGNYIISLGNFCRWLAEQAETLGVEIYPGFAAVDAVYDESGAITGIVTGDMGIDKHGERTDQFEPGVEIQAKQVLLAEGCRGSLTKKIIKQFKLDKNSDPQTYGIGIKELWQVDAKKHHPGLVIHTVGWPLDNKTYGGSFLYHLENNQVAVGFVIGLDYENPYLNPFEEMQRYKTHPAIRDTFIGGKRISYGARALNEGGLQSLPKLTFPGGAIIGCSAGFLNVPKIKGNHLAMKSGMLAAETIFAVLTKHDAFGQEIETYTTAFKHSWAYEELHRVRNIRPGFRHGIHLGMLNAALETYIFRGHSPWTLANHADYASLKPAINCKKINYPKPDGKISFDKLSSVYISNTNHAENQPCHLQIKNAKFPVEVNLTTYAGPEQYYCPANVYEYLQKNGKYYLQINAANCVHCKTCDIKDPKQNINWAPPQGGDGP
ncbi:MAG: electron transfer flavoprotein-ubiquinone oxidoreductase, partial [Pseudomonadota bacterium]